MGPIQPASPAIHFHLADSPLGEILAPARSHPTSSTKRKRETDDPSSDEDSSDDEAVILISDVLNALHAKRPALNYPQYEAALTKAGIAYASAALDFQKAFYESEVGMPKGAVGDFMRAVKKTVKREKKRGKRVRVEKENDASSTAAADL